MKQMVTPSQMVSLSSIARKRYDEYCKSKEWGYETGEGFVSLTQLSIGQLLEFLNDHK